MENLQKLKHAFSEGLSIPIDQVNEDLKYQGIAEWDSMSHLFLIKEIENSFGLSIQTEDILEMTSFNNAKDILHKLDVTFN